MTRHEARVLETLQDVQGLYEEYLEVARVGDFSQVLEADRGRVNAHRPDAPLTVSVGQPRS